MTTATKKKKSVPSGMKFRQSLFWDVDPKTIDPDKHARYIIERILDLGNDKEVRWMWRRYSREMIQKILALPRVQVHEKSRALWSLILQ